MKIINSILILVLLFFSFTACSSKKRVVAVKKNLPSWYENPQQSTTASLYAVAQGENKSDAIANALNEIVSTLSISISSEFNVKSVVQEGTIESIQTTSMSDIQTKVEQIRINNYTVINSNDFSFERYLVEVKTDKNSLFHSLKQDLDQKIQIIEDNNQEAKNYHAIKELEIYKESVLFLKDFHSSLVVMHSLNENFNDSSYVKKSQNIHKHYNRLLSKISFSVNTNNDAKILKDSIQKGLSEKKYNISNKQDKKHFRIYVSSKTLKAKSYGFDLARSAISITVKDYEGNVIGSNKLNITGQSTQGYKIAKENVAIKLNTLIYKDSISKVIGLDI